MNAILFHYEKVNPTTWVYLSSLLMIGLFFKFNRFWSVRNLDLVLLILFAPGLLVVNLGLPAVVRLEKQLEQAKKLEEASSNEASLPTVPVKGDASPSTTNGNENSTADPMPTITAIASAISSNPGGNSGIVLKDKLDQARSIAWFGFFWLFIASAFLLVRLLFDPTMVRRPLLEPNLSVGGLLFIGCFLFAFLVANVINGDVTQGDIKGAQGAASIAKTSEAGVEKQKPDDYRRFGPGYYFLHIMPSVATSIALPAEDSEQRQHSYVVVAKTMAILSNLAIVIGLVLIGYWHFENIRTGIGAAMLYLMLPYTAQMTGCVEHVLPAALLIWAIVFYRRPGVAGGFIGLAMGTVYYPFFLLPLWLSFYWQRGVRRFVIGVMGSLLVMALALLAASGEGASFWEMLQAMFGLWVPRRELKDGLEGIWKLGWDPNFRLPVLAAFVALAVSMAIWPAQKNLGTLLSCSAAIMVATQFWHGNNGGVYMAWYLPLTVLTIFRPNLEDRVALSVLGEGWFNLRRNKMPPLERAA